jgi:homoserine kinase type II
VSFSLASDRDTFSAEELAVVLSHYDLGVISDIREFLRGSRRSPKLIITAERGRYLLKRRAKGRDNPYRVAFAHSIQMYLASKGFPIAQLVGTRYDNNSMMQLQKAVYELFEFVEAEHYDGSLTATLKAASTLGLYHKLLSEFRSEWEPSRGSYHDANGVRTGLNTVPSSLGSHESVFGREAEVLGVVQRLYDAYDDCAEAANRHGFADWPEQIVHSDWHPGNMLFKAGAVAAVLDYDAAKLAPRVTDIANGLLQFTIITGSDSPEEWPDHLDESRVKRFLLGYNEVGTMTTEEVRAIPALMVQALIAEAVLPIAATGSFGRMQGFGFLRMVERKVNWLRENGDRVIAIL